MHRSLRLLREVVAQRAVVASPASDTVAYLHGDHLGSVSAATGGTGTLLSRQAYSPWGALRAGGGDITQTTLDCTGQRRDGTGLLFYNARYYDPQLGRFVSPDSVAPDKGGPQTRNRYSYVLNNPLKYVDPSGRCFENPQGNEERGENTRCHNSIGAIADLGVEIAGFAAWTSEQLE